jgi:hypothetical protein
VAPPVRRDGAALYDLLTLSQEERGTEETGSGRGSPWLP